MVMALTAITSFAPSLFAPSLSHPTTTSVIYSPSAFVRTTFSGLKYQRPLRLRPVFSAAWPFAGTTNLEDNNDEESKKLRVKMIDLKTFETINLNVHFYVVRNLPPVFKDRAENILKEAKAIMESDATNQRDYGDIAERMVVLFQDIVDYVGNRRKEEKIMDFCLHPLGIFTIFLCCILCFFGRLAGSCLRLLGCCCCIRWLMSSVSKILSNRREEEEEDQ